MGVFTLSGSPSNTLPDLRLTSISCHVRKTPVLAFRSDQEIAQKPKLTASADSLPPAIETVNHHPRKRRNPKPRKAVNVATLDAVEVDYREAAAALENLFQLSPTHVFDSEMESVSGDKSGGLRQKKEETGEMEESGGIVRSGMSRRKRLTLNSRISLKNEKIEGMLSSKPKSKGDKNVNMMLRKHSDPVDLVSIDWKNMKIPPVLPSSQHILLFETMQPMKAIIKAREELENVLQREATDMEVASAMNMSVPEIRKQMQVGESSRSKLIKHNLRLVLFAVNKYYQELAIGSKFQDLCQAGAKGLIMAIDRFEPKHGSRLSTYGLFWIRHAILRSLTISSFTRVSFGLESLRLEIRKAKQQLLFELGRMPTEEEIVEKAGISSERYGDVMRASKRVLSLNAKHCITQEEFVKGVTDMEGIGVHRRRSPALLRLALDDVLDSLKPKESLVIRQRFGLDGNGDRTLGEVAGNLNISREMVRQHELKALMKLKHPARVDYLRPYIA